MLKNVKSYFRVQPLFYLSKTKTLMKASNAHSYPPWNPMIISSKLLPSPQIKFSMNIFIYKLGMLYI